MMPDSDDESAESEDIDDDDNFPTRGPTSHRDALPPASSSSLNPFATSSTAVSTTGSYMPLKAAADAARLFTREEMANLPPSVIDRQKLKQQAKKAKKRKVAAEKTEGELMYGFMGMDVQEQEPVAELDDEAIRRISSGKKARREKKKARAAGRPVPSKGAQGRAQKSQNGMEMEGEDGGGMMLDEDAKKEADFANFLANVGGESLGW